MTAPDHQDPLVLAQQLRPILARLELLWARRAAQQEVSRAQLALLTLLRDRGPLRISELAKIEGIRMPTASNAIHQLEKLDLVERTQDTSDRRGVVVALTDYGVDFISGITATRDKQFAELFEELDPEQLEVAVNAVPVIRAMLENYAGTIESERRKKLADDQ